jgi:D-alanyl-D-alanine carboxypeptidase
MMGINSLSGYIKTKKGSMIAFSIIINNFTSPSYEIKKIQDDVIKLIINEL